MNKHQRLHFWRQPSGKNLEETREAARLAKKYLYHPITGKHLYRSIVEEYLDAKEEIAWDLWQELADTSRTPPDILRRLHDKNRWYLDILLVNLRACPKDILELFAHLPVQKTHNLKDKNKEIREVARKRLGLGPLIENGSAK